ncbi:uncharacterized protein LOC127804923 [Diospyros lotus]|uniref:uncharacterized protein LOC127804923 n=1 Tax=Diospyros lotus TaxID=55363 RepID=UPI00224D7997|nr:uncharacterized protein LOC127804923 [Diospyros lotus]
MAPLQYNSFTNLLLLYSALFLFTSLPIVLAQPLSHGDSSLATRRLLLELQKESQSSIKKKSSTNTTLSSPQNQTKLIKSTSTSPQNQTKLIKTTASSPQNQSKLIKLASETAKNKTKLVQSAKDANQEKANLNKAQLKKLNSTVKSSNSTKVSSNLAKKTPDLIKQISPKNKTTKPITSKPSQTQLDKKLSEQLKSKNPEKPKPNPTKTQKPTQPSWADQDDEDDLVAEFRDLTSKFQETLLPDLERISTTSKVYLTRANKEITKGFKPIVGTKYAATVASTVSFAFIVIPLILVSLIFHRIKAYFSLQKLLIFIQVYLAIYFSILCLSSVVTGLEPLKFFYATSWSTYVCVQVLQTLAYVLYLLLLLMYLVLVFSTETGPASKMLGLGQTFVGFAVGLHYYVAVFHRVVLHQPPKTSWKVHAMYATCFVVICLLARADRRKKAYLEDGGEEGKKS